MRAWKREAAQHLARVARFFTWLWVMEKHTEWVQWRRYDRELWESARRRESG